MEETWREKIESAIMRRSSAANIPTNGTNSQIFHEGTSELKYSETKNAGRPTVTSPRSTVTLITLLLLLLRTSIPIDNKRRRVKRFEFFRAIRITLRLDEGRCLQNGCWCVTVFICRFFVDYTYLVN